MKIPFVIVSGRSRQRGRCGKGDTLRVEKGRSRRAKVEGTVGFDGMKSCKRKKTQDKRGEDNMMGKKEVSRCYPTKKHECLNRENEFTNSNSGNNAGTPTRYGSVFIKRRNGECSSRPSSAKNKRHGRGLVVKEADRGEDRREGGGHKGLERK